MPAALTNNDQKFWQPRTDIQDWLTRTIPADASVLDVGPGTAPFPRADLSVDWRKPDAVAESKFRQVDIQKDRLPFEDKSFDFVYCRHVLEDLHDPFSVCAEMSRVGKAGYIETPSPLAEVCSGIDGNSPPWRGYHHHRFVIWTSDDTLCFLSKYPVIEYARIDEDAVAASLREGPRLWNTHFVWRDRINFRFFQHEVDYWITQGYSQMLGRAIQECRASSATFEAQVADSLVR
jgi:hypothetical protein